MTAFAHWTAMHAWWIARRTERDAIGKPWAPKGTTLAAAEQRMKTDTQRTHPAPADKPDEGAEVSAADVAALKARYLALEPAAKEWTTALVKQGNNGHSWRIKEQATVRRYELYRGVMALAEWMADTMSADEIICATVYDITNDTAAIYPTVEPGMVLGALDADQAAKFAEVADGLAHDRYALVADEASGTLRVQPVARTTQKAKP